MLKTGKALHSWVTGQLLGRLKGEIIKRTALQTVMGAVALPMTVYKTTGMVVDNEWIQGTVRLQPASTFNRLIRSHDCRTVQGKPGDYWRTC